MINTDGETFLNASEAARYVGISRVSFYKDCISGLQAFRIGKCRRKYYKLSQLVRLRSAEPVAKVA